MRPILCPICTRSTLERLFDEVKIEALVDGEQRVVGGVLAYKCTEFGHVFFVQKADVEVGPELPYAA